MGLFSVSKSTTCEDEHLLPTGDTDTKKKPRVHPWKKDTTMIKKSSITAEQTQKSLSGPSKDMDTKEILFKPPKKKKTVRNSIASSKQSISSKPKAKSKKKDMSSSTTTTTTKKGPPKKPPAPEPDDENLLVSRKRNVKNHPAKTVSSPQPEEEESCPAHDDASTITVVPIEDDQEVGSTWSFNAHPSTATMDSSTSDISTSLCSYLITDSPPPTPSKPAATVAKRSLQSPTASLSTADSTKSGGSFYDQDLDTRELVRQFLVDVWNMSKWGVIPHACTRNVRYQSPGITSNGNAMELMGAKSLESMIRGLQNSLQDFYCDIHSMVVDEDHAFCRLQFRGKHVGMLMGHAATGRDVSFPCMMEFTCRNGKIATIWQLEDRQELESQLGYA